MESNTNNSERISEQISAFMKFEHIELSESTDQDLMRIKCFGCHEGINENGTEFPREALKDAYKTFIDKPIVISADTRNMPTGHAYDHKRRKFIEEKRKYIGHIVDAYPCIVTPNGEIILITDDEEITIDGEYRIICEFVVYKRYMSEIAAVLTMLHNNDNLNFSMESIVDYYLSEDGVKHCTNIQFTALTIVKNPAFKNSISLEIAEKEDSLMDFEKMYEEASARIETLIQEKTKFENDYETVVREREVKETEVTTLKEELASVKAELAEANATIENLTPYKKKVETAEKLEVGNQRLEKLSKYGEVTKTAEELAEISKEEYADMLLEMAENYKPVSEPGITGVPFVDSKVPNRKNELMEILKTI